MKPKNDKRSFHLERRFHFLHLGYLPTDFFFFFLLFRNDKLPKLPELSGQCCILVIFILWRGYLQLFSKLLSNTLRLGRVPEQRGIWLQHSTDSQTVFLLSCLNLSFSSCDFFFFLNKEQFFSNTSGRGSNKKTNPTLRSSFPLGHGSGEEPLCHLVDGGGCLSPRCAVLGLVRQQLISLLNRFRSDGVT